jgi:hypothetical protein
MAQPHCCGMFESGGQRFLSTKNENNATNNHYANSDVRLPVYTVLVILCYLEFPQVHNLLLRDIGKTRIQGHEQTHDEDDDASCFHDCDPSLDVHDRHRLVEVGLIAIAAGLGTGRVPNDDVDSVRRETMQADELHAIAL